MKKLIVILLLLGLLVGCRQNVVKPDSPLNTAHIMKLSIDEQDYERFNQLFSEGKINTVTKSEFERLHTLTSARTTYSNYELLTFENGSMVLVKLTPPNEDGEIEIEDIKVVPREMKSLFAVE